MLRTFFRLLPAFAAACPLFAEPVLVGKYAAKIVPEQLSVLTFHEIGEVSDLAPEGRVSAGTVVATLNKKRTQEAREDMEFRLAKDRLACRDELRKLQQQRENLVFYLKLSESERRYAADTLPEGMKPGPESLRDIDERIALTQRELDTMERRSFSEFEREHGRNTLRMPFNGRLQYNISLPEDRSKPFELTNLLQNFATACDDSAFYVTLAVSGSDISLLPEKSFSVRVALPEGRELVGSYARRRVERASHGGDMLVFFFRLPAEDADTAFAMLGSNTTAALYYEAEGAVERIRKAELATHPAAGECESWAELVTRVYPGAVIVLVADRDIVIRRAAEQGAEAQSTEGEMP